MHIPKKKQNTKYKTKPKKKLKLKLFFIFEFPNRLFFLKNENKLRVLKGV